MVAAVEHGKIGVAGFVAAGQFHAGDFAGHVFGFVFFAAAGNHFYRIAFPKLRPQGFGKQLGIVGDYLVGHAQDAAGRAVVLFEFDHFNLRVILLQQAQVFHIGAAPGVDGLVVVAHGGKHAFQAGKLAQQAVLAGVGVLAFVHQQIAQPPLPFEPQIAVLLQQQHRQTD